jgi:hypothetical protein
MVVFCEALMQRFGVAETETVLSGLTVIVPTAETPHAPSNGILYPYTPASTGVPPITIVFPCQVAVTPGGSPLGVPIPVAPVVVCVISGSCVLIHTVGVEDAPEAVQFTTPTALPAGCVPVVHVNVPGATGVPEAVSVIGWQPGLVKFPAPENVTPFCVVVTDQIPGQVTLAYNVIVTPLTGNPAYIAPWMLPKPEQPGPP